MRFGVCRKLKNEHCVAASTSCMDDFESASFITRVAVTMTQNAVASISLTLLPAQSSGLFLCCFVSEEAFRSVTSPPHKPESVTHGSVSTYSIVACWNCVSCGRETCVVPNCRVACSSQTGCTSSWCRIVHTSDYGVFEHRCLGESKLLQGVARLLWGRVSGART